MVDVLFPEMLHHSIHEEKKTNHFYLLETVLHWLDNHDEIANFHLIPLIRNHQILGFTRYLFLIDMPFFQPIEGSLHLSCR
jgi:DNA repair protein RecO (recombination protein O)